MTFSQDDSRVDLHVHTTASDGTMAPREIVLRAKAVGLAAVAITDHDSIGGVAEALVAGREHGLEVVPGVEIGIAHDPERHLVEVDILGYFVDQHHPELVEALGLLQKAKNEKLQKQLAVLAQNGYQIESVDVLAAAAGDTVRRPHIWKVLRERYPSLRAELFFEKTSFGGDWHVPKEFSLSLEAAVDLIERSGGVPVMAHPGVHNSAFARNGTLIDPEVDKTIATCVGAGVKGVEVFYSYNKNRPYWDGEELIDDAQYSKLIDHYFSQAESHGVLKTGGTDFHGSSKPQIELGEVDVPYSLLDALRRARPHQSHS